MDIGSKSGLFGTIISIAPDEDDDLGEAVKILTSEGEIAYDYEDYWLEPAVKVGATVKITGIKSTVSTNQGPLSYLMDVKIEVING